MPFSLAGTESAALADLTPPPGAGYVVLQPPPLARYAGGLDRLHTGGDGTALVARVGSAKGVRRRAGPTCASYALEPGLATALTLPLVGRVDAGSLFAAE